MEENEHLRTTYNLSYKEMIDAFALFKTDMEKKQSSIDSTYDEKVQQIEKKFIQEIENRGLIIDDLRKENAFLKEKFGKIKDVFDWERPQNMKRGVLEDTSDILNI